MKPAASPVHAPSATRAGARVALITCDELPGLDPDDQLLLPAFAALGIRGEAAVWDDPAVDWSAFDLAIVRSTWDYAKRRDEFVAWAASVPALANSAAMLAWNTDKRYLRELTDVGIPIVPTTWLSPSSGWTPSSGWAPAGSGPVVIKPAVSAGSLDTGRYDLATQLDLATAHIARLLEAGRTVMVQPYLAAVDTAGETALLYFAGQFSHAIRKGALLSGPDVGVAGLYKQEEISARTPSAAERTLAERVLAAVPFGEALYARVDLLPGDDGEPVLIELELTEPSLFFGACEPAAARFADAVAARLLPRDQG